MKLTSVERKLAKLEAAVDALPSQRKRVLVAIVDDTEGRTLAACIDTLRSVRPPFGETSRC